MNGNSGLELLFQYAREFKFNDFTRLLQVLEAARPLEELWEAYLMRAQIKLYAADATALADLEMIARFNGPPEFQRLSDIWPADAPNRFSVFPKAPGALRGFLQTLPRVRQRLNQWYGDQGDIAVSIIQAEIHYFLGEIQQALDCAEERYHSGLKNKTDDILVQCLRFRCYLALFLPGRAEKCLLDMIRLSQAHAECLASYQAFRVWANLTTNWNGDRPRFYDDPSGKRWPILEDRVEGVRLGCGNTTPLEEPFVSYAESSYENAYAIRAYYMDLLHAMYWFQAGDHQQTEAYFRKLYHTAVASGVFMQFVECGEQITPLLQYVKDSNWGCSRQWLDMVISRAGQYEKCLNAYKDSDV